MRALNADQRLQIRQAKARGYGQKRDEHNAFLSAKTQTPKQAKMTACNVGQDKKGDARKKFRATAQQPRA